MSQSCAVTANLADLIPHSLSGCCIFFLPFNAFWRDGGASGEKGGYRKRDPPSLKHSLVWKLFSVVANLEVTAVM